MSHFCVDNDSANHNQEANGLFSQSEEPRRDGCLGSALAFPAASALPSAVPGYLRRRGGLGIPLPARPVVPRSVALCLSDRPTDWPRPRRRNSVL